VHSGKIGQAVGIERNLMRTIFHVGVVKGRKIAKGGLWDGGTNQMKRR